MLSAFMWWPAYQPWCLSGPALLFELECVYPVAVTCLLRHAHNSVSCFNPGRGGRGGRFDRGGRGGRGGRFDNGGRGGRGGGRFQGSGGAGRFQNGHGFQGGSGFHGVSSYESGSGGGQGQEGMPLSGAPAAAGVTQPANAAAQAAGAKRPAEALAGGGQDGEASSPKRARQDGDAAGAAPGPASVAAAAGVTAPAEGGGGEQGPAEASPAAQPGVQMQQGGRSMQQQWGGRGQQYGGRGQQQYGGRGQQQYGYGGRGGQEQQWGGRGGGRQQYGRAPSPAPRKPSLLQKLLAKDIRRDRSYLLQCFRSVLARALSGSGAAQALVRSRLTLLLQWTPLTCLSKEMCCQPGCICARLASRHCSTPTCCSFFDAGSWSSTTSWRAQTAAPRCTLRPARSGRQRPRRRSCSCWTMPQTQTSRTQRRVPPSSARRRRQTAADRLRRPAALARLLPRLEKKRNRTRSRAAERRRRQRRRQRWRMWWWAKQAAVLRLRWMLRLARNRACRAVSCQLHRRQGTVRCSTRRRLPPEP